MKPGYVVFKAINADYSCLHFWSLLWFSPPLTILKIETQVKLARYKVSKVFGVAFKWLEEEEEVCLK